MKTWNECVAIHWDDLRGTDLSKERFDTVKGKERMAAIERTTVFEKDDCKQALLLCARCRH